MALMSPLFEHNLQTNKTLWNWTKALSNWKYPHVAGGVRTTIAKHHHRFRLKWRILICFSSQKKSKQILANEIKKHDLRKELHLLKSKAYNRAKFLDLRRHLENFESTMHRNRSAHTTCARGESKKKFMQLNISLPLFLLAFLCLVPSRSLFAGYLS